MAQRSIWTGDATANTFEQDFSSLVLAPPLPGGELTLWRAVSKAADGTEPTKFEWIEEELSQITVELGAALTTNGTAATFAAGEISAAGLRAGALLANATDTTKVEVILVSSVDSATSATIVRDYGGFVSGGGGGTTGQTHSNGDKLRVIGYLNWEGSDVVEGTYDQFVKRDRTPAYNYYSIVDDWTQISGSDMVRVYRGEHPDNWSYQVEGVLQRLERQFEWKLLRSPQVQRTASQRGSMGGILWYVTQTAGSHYVTTAANFSYEVVDDGLLYLYNRNGLDDIDPVMIVPPAGAQAAAYIHESAMRGTYSSENVRGLQATMFKSTLTGKTVPIVINQGLPSDSFLIVNMRALRVHFLQGRGLKMYDQPLGELLKDYRRQRWLSELTLEFQRVADNCYYHNNVTWVRPS